MFDSLRELVVQMDTYLLPFVRPYNRADIAARDDQERRRITLNDAPFVSIDLRRRARQRGHGVGLCRQFDFQPICWKERKWGRTCHTDIDASIAIGALVATGVPLAAGADPCSTRRTQGPTVHTLTPTPATPSPPQIQELAPAHIFLL